ncbi:MAG: FtsX-like permease family protein [Gemmatimonas sp.]|nr:FtsX-like permease family protein [Gemmatimonas sp.]
MLSEFWSDLRYRLRAILRRDVLERDLDDELRFHIEREAEKYAAEGLRRDRASRRARVAFGGLDQIKEKCRDLGRVNLIEDRWKDLRHSVRGLRRSPGFTAATILTLALGIGANTAVFSILHAALLRPLPFDEPERLMSVALTTPSRFGQPPRDDFSWSYPKFELFREDQRVFSDLAVHTTETTTLEHLEDPPERLSSEVVGANYFRTLGVAPIVGRDFSAEEDTTQGVQVAMLSHSLWTRSLNGDPSVVGQTVRLDGRLFEVVGVMERGFRGLSGAAEIWLPSMVTDPSDLDDPQTHSFSVVARLGPGISREQAQSAVRALGERVDRAFPSSSDGEPWGAITRPLNAERVDPMLRRTVLVLFSAVSLVLLIACTNVASLLLARGTARTREVAVRLAIGASRPRLVRQLLTESLLLAFLGAMAGILLAWISLYLLLPTESGLRSVFASIGGDPSGLSLLVLSSIRIDGAILFFTAVAACLAAGIFGVVPAWRASKVGLSKTLRSGEEAVRALGHGRAFTGRGLLVSGEIAVALVVLIATGLTLRSLDNLLASPIGFEPERVLTLRFLLPLDEYEAEAAPLVVDQMLETVRAVPGVEAAAIGNCSPLSGDCNATTIIFRDRPPAAPGFDETIGLHQITPDYLKTLQVPLLEGRALEPTDRGDTRKVLLINESAARRFWPNDNPIGKIVGVGAGSFGEGEIVGIVGDLRYGTIDEASRPDVFISYLQTPRPNGFLYVRAASRSDRGRRRGAAGAAGGRTAGDALGHKEHGATGR